MRRRLFLVASLVVGLIAAVPVAATSASAATTPPCPPGTAPDVTGIICVAVDKVTTALGAQLGAAATAQAVAAQESGWLGNALELQHHLGDTLPLRDAMWVGTHNSFNTVSNMPPSVSNLDSNQHVSLVDQLRLGVRGIEVDVHWMPSIWTFFHKAPVVCHGRPPSEFNLGCTYERLLGAELTPVGNWLRDPAHRSDVVLLYIEDNINEPAGYESAAAAVNATIGDLVYRPPVTQPCQLLPLSLRRADVLAAGKQVVIMSGCGAAGSAPGWQSTVFDDSIRSEQGNPDFAGYPACTSTSVAAADYGTKLVRFYEDSTLLSALQALAVGQRFTIPAVRDMVRCGVNLFGLDQVSPSDPRLDAMVWGWAANEPSTNAAGSCAYLGGDARFHAAGCGSRPLPYACTNAGTGQWFVTVASGAPGGGAAACAAEHPGSTFAVPGSGNHQQRLADAQALAGGSDVWVAYATSGGAWVGSGA